MRSVPWILLGVLLAVAILAGLFWFGTAAGAERQRTTIDLEFVVLIGAVDHKPIYVNPRAVTYIAPHEDGITRIGFIGGAVRSVLMNVDDVAAALMAPPALAKGNAP